MATEVQATEYDYDALGVNANIVRGLANRIHKRVRRAVEDVIEIGLCLAETKRFLGHGEWGVWLKAEFDWSDDTAINYMNVAARYSQIPNYLEFAPTVLYELCKPSTPIAAIECAAEMVRGGAKVSVALAKEIIDEHRDADDDEPSDPDGVPWNHDEPIGEVVAKRTAKPEPVEVEEPAHTQTDRVQALIEVRDDVLQSFAESIQRRDAIRAIHSAIEFVRILQGT